MMVRDRGLVAPDVAVGRVPFGVTRPPSTRRLVGLAMDPRIAASPTSADRPDCRPARPGSLRPVTARVLVIDNYDSFVYNLVQYLGELGAEPIVARHDALTLDEIDALEPDGILISPGPGRPEDAGLSNESSPTSPAAAPCSACAWACSASARCTAARSCAPPK